MGIWYMRKILLGDDIYNHHTSILAICCFFLPKLRWTNAVRGWDRNWSWKRFLKFLLHVMTCFLEVGANPCERPWLFWCSRCLVDESSVFTSGTMKSHSPTLLQVWNVRIWREIMCIKAGWHFLFPLIPEVLLFSWDDLLQAQPTLCCLLLVCCSKALDLLWWSYCRREGRLGLCSQFSLGWRVSCLRSAMLQGEQGTHVKLKTDAADFQR